MNRRNFLKRGAAGAVAAAVVVVPTLPAEKTTIKTIDFPETREEMEAIVSAAMESGKYNRRYEGGLLQDGLSRTDTMLSTHWYFHKGGRVAVLHLRECDSHVCFDIENIRDSKTVYYPPYGKNI